ncbi:hypothetical protein E2562_026267 [Oryza meyeriana var. granulata]|uniref:Uncharacterized protein n=1 Tax=Oryza meyeriana var. granulata TaxID=110450 RepID=A0A6G1CHQ4_9ORYZ|nr:hypothetical protein E2562_026267 [Oryza meyeriana var. granulata]
MDVGGLGHRDRGPSSTLLRDNTTVCKLWSNPWLMAPLPIGHYLNHGAALRRKRLETIDANGGGIFYQRTSNRQHVSLK